MKRVLAVGYTQTGQLRRALDSLLGGLDPEQVEVHVEDLRPRPDYPFPWPFYRFLDAFPESVLGVPPELATPSFDPDEEWDQVILAYTVWFLAPSLPVQAFLRSDHARVLRGRPVVTLCACRNMWHTAHLRLGEELDGLGEVSRHHEVSNLLQKTTRRSMRIRKKIMRIKTTSKN